MSRRGKKGVSKKRSGNAADLGSTKYLHLDWNIYDDLTLCISGPPTKTSGRRTLTRHGKVVAAVTTRQSLATNDGEHVSAVLINLEGDEEGAAYWLDPDRFNGLEISSPIDPDGNFNNLTAKKLKGTKTPYCYRHQLSLSFPGAIGKAVVEYAMANPVKDDDDGDGDSDQGHSDDDIGDAFASDEDKGLHGLVRGAPSEEVEEEGEEEEVEDDDEQQPKKRRTPKPTKSRKSSSPPNLNRSRSRSGNLGNSFFLSLTISTPSLIQTKSKKKIS